MRCQHCDTFFDQDSWSDQPGEWIESVPNDTHKSFQQSVLPCPPIRWEVLIEEFKAFADDPPGLNQPAFISSSPADAEPIKPVALCVRTDREPNHAFGYFGRSEILPAIVQCAVIEPLSNR
jgi:hypothetical protein